MKRMLLLIMAVSIYGIITASSPLRKNNTNIIVQDPEFDKFGIGFGIGFGFFYPSDVNDWLDEKYSNYMMQFGSIDLFMNEQIAFVASFRPVKMLRININAEAGIGPKLVNTNDAGTNFHNFGRYSAGTEAYLNVPIGSGKHSVLFGAGVSYHHIYFEEYRGNTIGLRIIPFGMSFNFGGFQPQILLGGDLLSKATDGTFELNYNHGFIHINLLF